MATEPTWPLDIERGIKLSRGVNFRRRLLRRPQELDTTKRPHSETVENGGNGWKIARSPVTR